MRDLQPWREAILKGEMPPQVTKTLVQESIPTEESGGILKSSFVISTGDEDRDGDIVEPSGWDLDSFRANSVILWAHDNKQPPIARAESISVSNAKLKAVAVWPERGIYPFADTICGLVKGGFIKGTSVGFHPIAAEPRKTKGIRFLKQELYEFSVLPIPSNRAALVEAKAAGFDVTAVSHWAEEFLAYAEKSGLWVPKFSIEKALKAVMAPSITVPGMPAVEKIGPGFVGPDRRRASSASVYSGPERRKKKREKKEVDLTDIVMKFIREEGGKFNVYSESGKLLGTHDTRAEAVNQLRAIEANKGGGTEVITKEQQRDELGRFASDGGGSARDEARGLSEGSADPSRPAGYDPSGSAPSLSGRGRMFDSVGKPTGDAARIAEGAAKERYPGRLADQVPQSFKVGIQNAMNDIHRSGFGAVFARPRREGMSQLEAEGYRAFLAHYAERDPEQPGLSARADARRLQRERERGRKDAETEIEKLAEIIFGPEDEMTHKETPPFLKEEPEGEKPDAAEDETMPKSAEMPAGGADAIMATLMQEITPLAVPGGNPVQVAPALKAALEKFAAAFMQQFAGAPAAPPTAAPQGATPPLPTGTPPPPEKGSDMFDAVVKMLDEEPKPFLDPAAFEGLTFARLGEIVEASVKAVAADHRMKTTGRLPD